MDPSHEAELRATVEDCPDGAAWDCGCRRFCCYDVKALLAALDEQRMECLGYKKAYELLQKGMESQAELMDGLKQELRQLQKAYQELLSEVDAV